MSVLLTASLVDIVLITVICECEHLLGKKQTISMVLEKIKIALAISTLILILAFVAVIINNNAILS